MHTLGARWAYQSVLSLLEEAETRQSHLVWFHLTAFLQHAAMISKFLKPVSNSANKEVAHGRGTALRDALGVGPDSDVLPRDARDNVEHFDERMDRWVLDLNSTILEIVVDDREGFEFLRVADKNVKRLLIADELVFISERKDGTKFELCLTPVYSELERIALMADQWMRLNSPYKVIHPR